MSKDPLVGAVLHDTHEVVRLIGQGGMGAVYEAVHKRLRNQRFAIKVLHAKMMENKKIFARFQREAEIATAVGHPSIVYVLDFYETDDGRPCMVMEFLEGEDLGQRLEREDRIMPADEVLRIMEQVGGALQAVHDKGVIHRDMKPANIFLVKAPDGEQRIKVLDFGISKMKDCNTQLTGDHSVLGTPHYMSPEQGEGQVKDVDHRTDIFALGTICYQMLSGTVPFDGPTLPGVIYKICHVDPEPVTERVEDLPKAVHQVLVKALAKKREDRYQQAMDFVDDLKAALTGGEVKGLAEEKQEEGGVPRETAVIDEKEDTDNAVGGETVAEEVQELDAPDDAADDDIESGDTVVSADASVARSLTVAETREEAARRIGSEPTLLRDGAQPPTLTTLSESAGETLASEAKPKKGRAVMAAAAVGVVVLVIGLVAALRYQGKVDAPPPAVTTTTPATRVAEPKEAAISKPAPGAVSTPTAPKQVKVTLKLTPPGAQVRLDGRLHKENPLVVESGKAYHLRVEAPGHVARERELRVQENHTLEMTLNAKQKPVAPQKRKRRKGKKKALPFGGDLDDGKAPPRKKKKKKKATPFSGDL